MITHFILTKGTINQEDIIILNKTPNSGLPNCILPDFKIQINPNSEILSDFNIQLSPMDLLSEQKIEKFWN